MYQKISKTLCLGLLIISTFLLFNQAIAGVGKSKLTRFATVDNLSNSSDSFELPFDSRYIKYFTDNPANKVTLSYCRLSGISDNYLIYLSEEG
ncbi:MAG: hypothetical protein HAW62_05770 [Endozoicomonadaceae bacterium]|nr:hypothetical protein [Endozoicomonadaceae bacterium]